MQSDKNSNSWQDLFAEGRLSRLLFLGMAVWTGAADSLVTATIMPSVARELGGEGLFSWGVAGFMLGALLAGASAGRLSERLGLRLANCLAGTLLVIGCLLSALATDIYGFIGGRLVQGIGGGWLSGFAMVAVAFLFPERHVARVFALATSIWGIATIISPLLGGFLADMGHWRWVFWLFVAQSLLLIGLSWWLLDDTARNTAAKPVSVVQLGLLCASLLVLGIASSVGVVAQAIALLAMSLLLLGIYLWRENRIENGLLPRGVVALGSSVGAGYLAMFAMTMSLTCYLVYAPPLLQARFGLSPLHAGYLVAIPSMSWTLGGLLVSNFQALYIRAWSIRVGGLCVLSGTGSLAYSLGGGGLWWIGLSAALLGLGFGLSSSLLNRQILAELKDEERAIGSSALTAVRQMGNATGAAVFGVLAVIVGFAGHMSDAVASQVANNLFLLAIPFSLCGATACWRAVRPFTVARESGDCSRSSV